MIEDSISRLGYLCDIIPPLLSAIDEPAFSEKPAPGKWSKKQIIGHLVDSASNNHHRFVRAQFEEDPEITYNQDKWNEFGYYQQIDGQLIIALWLAYNKLLLELIRRIPSEKLQRTCSANGKSQTLAFLIDDYVSHMEHHLQQVVSY